MKNKVSIFIGNIIGNKPYKKIYYKMPNFLKVIEMKKFLLTVKISN